jgi:hypothetical protein
VIVAILRLGEGQPARTVLGRGVAKGNGPARGRREIWPVTGRARRAGTQPKTYLASNEVPDFLNRSINSSSKVVFLGCSDWFANLALDRSHAGRGTAKRPIPAARKRAHRLPWSTSTNWLSSRKSPRHASARPEEEPQDRRLLRSARSSHPCCYERCQGRGARGFPGDRPGSAEPVSFAFAPPGLGSVLLFPQR